MTEAQIIDGKAFAARLREKIADQVAALKQDHGLTPSLSVVLVGDDEASQVYVRNKGKQTEEAGMISATHRLAADTPESELLDLIGTLNGDKTVNGILVQMPLPGQIDDKVMDYIVDVVYATRQPKEYKLDKIEPLIEYGASPRASIFLNLAARANALLQGRAYVTPQDVKSIGMDVLRHRIIVSYEAEAEELTSEDVIRMIFDEVPVP